MLEKERDWKRVVRILADDEEQDWRSCKVLGGRVESVVKDDVIDESSKDGSKSKFLEDREEFR
jgi:hypothetical protein